MSECWCACEIAQLSTEQITSRVVNDLSIKDHRGYIRSDAGCKPKGSMLYKLCKCPPVQEVPIKT